VRGGAGPTEGWPTRSESSCRSTLKFRRIYPKKIVRVLPEKISPKRKPKATSQDGVEFRLKRLKKRGITGEGGKYRSSANGGRSVKVENPLPQQVDVHTYRDKKKRRGPTRGKSTPMWEVG